MRIVAVANQKGGAGKTTTTMSLAAVAAESARVLVVDVDPQASSSWWADRAGDKLPFDFTSDTDPANLSRLRELPYDVVFVDTPGSLEARSVLSAVIRDADFVILPTEPMALAFAPLVQTVRQLVEPTSTDYRVLLNKVDPRVPSAVEEAQALIDGAGLRRFNNVIRTYKMHADAPLRGDVVTQYDLHRSSIKAVDDYRRVALELFSIWTTAPAMEVL